MKLYFSSSSFSALYVCSFILMAAAVAGFVLLFFYYTKWDSCVENKIFIGVNAGLCFILTLISILPCMKRCKSPTNGLCLGKGIFVIVWCQYNANSQNMGTLC